MAVDAMVAPKLTRVVNPMHDMIADCGRCDLLLSALAQGWRAWACLLDASSAAYFAAEKH